MKVLITGATGLIGRKLIQHLLFNGHDVRALARTPQNLPELPQKNVYQWSDDKLPPSESLLGCDAVVHLAGEGIVEHRWSKARKKRLWDSRISGTKNLMEALSKFDKAQRPQILISSSAIGYYDQSDKKQTEKSDQGSGFLADLCAAWEEATEPTKKLGMRTVLLRTGLVLSKEGGVLQKTGPIILGDGKQHMSWIHIQDMVRFILFALENSKLEGPYNLTAPHPVTNLVFTKEVAKLRGYPFTVHAPALALKLALGEMSQVVLSDQNIIPQKILASGFKFEFDHIRLALKDLFQPTAKTK